jgi:RsiW-degrading membrane proteinase PrsW (M82 family)
VIFVDSEQKCVIAIHKPTINEKIFFFLSGFLVSIPFTLFFSQFTDLLCITLPIVLAQVCSIIIFAPLIEEFAKVIPLFYRHGETERSIVTLGILIGLGFGIAEMILYVFVLGVPFIVRIPGVIFHASSAGIASYGIAKKNFIPYYLLAVILHLANNFFALLADIFIALIAVLFILALTYFLAWRYYRRSSEEIVV